MAGKINRQVKIGKPILVNGRWEHQHLDDRPLSPKQLEKLTARAKEMGWKSA